MSNTILNWSGGKDACLALHKLAADDNYTVNKLLTTINKSRGRITMHGVRTDVLNAQVNALGYELEFVELPENITMNRYSEIIGNKAKQHQENGAEVYAYGDINLIDLRKFRDAEISQYNLKTTYPLWNKTTKDLGVLFLELGYKAIVVAISSDKLDESFCGRAYDQSFLDDLPAGVDPCGENGEFHTFVYDGPMFNHPINLQVGKKTYQTYSPSKEDDNCFCSKQEQKDWDTGFWFCDLTLA
tara:strand:+ start:2617 stop:3345 length:729 start_codon:yes stop_codon:yes gene_type:complete